MTRTPLVTVAIPVYTRLHYLPGALRSVEEQSYPEIELIVSDNGGNGEELGEIVRAHYHRPFRLRRTAGGIGITDHYNELLGEASGEYFVLLADDDELGPTFVAELAAALRWHAGAGLALARLEVMDEHGAITTGRRRPGSLPELMSGEDFIRMWCRNEYSFVCFTTTMARTAEVRAVGAYPPFPRGSGVDNALLIRLVLGRQIAFLPAATFRYRVYEASHGLSLPIEQLARDLRCFLAFLDRDPRIRDYAARHPACWAELRHALVRMTWGTYMHRWKRIYRPRMAAAPWVLAAFRLPFIGEYYWNVSRVLARAGARALKQRVLSRPQTMGA